MLKAISVCETKHSFYSSPTNNTKAVDPKQRSWCPVFLIASEVFVAPADPAVVVPFPLPAVVVAAVVGPAFPCVTFIKDILATHFPRMKCP